MQTMRRNFPIFLPIHAARAAISASAIRSRFFALRSLPSIVAAAIPRRFSSSSLPPSFVSGRFAGLSFSSGQANRLAEV